MFANVIVCSYFGEDEINIIGRGSSLVTLESSHLLGPGARRGAVVQAAVHDQRGENKQANLASMGPNIATVR